MMLNKELLINILRKSINILWLGLAALLFSGCQLTNPKPISSHQELPQEIVTKNSLWQSETKHIDNPIIMDQGDDTSVEFEASLQILINDPKLKKFVSEVITSNPDINSMIMRLKATEEQLNITKSTSRPSLELGLNKSRSNSLGSPDSQISYQLGMTWSLDLWGRYRDLAMAAKYDYEASHKELSHLKNLVSAQLIKICIQGWSLQERLLINQRHIDKLLQMKIILRDGYSFGKSTNEDLVNIRARLEYAYAEEEEIEQNLLQVKRSLTLLLGKTPNISKIDFTKLPKISSPPIRMPADVIVNRPDIQMAFLQLKSFDAQTKASYKALLPSFNLSGSYGASNFGSKGLFDQDKVWSLVGGVTQPIFQGGRLLSQARAQNYLAESSWWQYKKVVLNAITEVENSLSKEESISYQLEHLYAAKKEAKLESEIYQQRYKSGLADILELMQIQIKEADVEKQIVSLHAMQMSNRMDLSLAMGIGFYQIDNSDCQVSNKLR